MNLHIQTKKPTPAKSNQSRAGQREKDQSILEEEECPPLAFLRCLPQAVRVSKPEQFWRKDPPYANQAGIKPEADKSFGKKDSIKSDDYFGQLSDPYIPPPSPIKTFKSSDFLYGKKAYQHYLANKRELDNIENDIAKPHIALLRRRLIAKRNQIEEVAAKAQGVTKLQKGFSETDVRARLETIKDHSPWLIYIIMLIQGISIAILSSMAGVIPPRLSPQKIVVGEVMTWGGVQTVEHFIQPNMWAGPSQENLIQSGALYAPCLRKDRFWLLKNSVHQVETSELGCCEALGRGAGTSTQQECDEIRAIFGLESVKWVNVTCKIRSKNNKNEIHVAHEFKPCCLPSKGDCLLISHKHCVILGGIWHISAYEHCSEASCNNNLCQVYEGDDQTESSSAFQLWRLPLSVILHEGIVAAVLFALIIQGLVASDIERLAGWLRMLLIYIICGMGGLLFGSTMVPYRPNVGSTGAVCGFLAILSVELAQTWPLVEHKMKAVGKLVALTAIMLVAGLFPGVNQFTNLAGGVFGVLCSLSFMPYIVFSRRQRQPNYEGGLRFINCLAFVSFSCDLSLP
ncbi:inactive rhomboid protein 1-like [Watersipora subatra]|uniref:inactive rhomboid protein 1-like n=1 Tax=Watersipora subatra TaxID=2589382 RepID=UPI00355C5E74